MWHEYMTSRLSIVALNDQTGSLVGVITSYDYAKWSTLRVMEFPESLDPFLEILEDVKTVLPEFLSENGFTMAQANKGNIVCALDSCIVDKSMMKRRIGGKLI